MPDRRNLRLAYLGFLILPLAGGMLYLFLQPEWLLSRYAFRPFTLGERLLTEARVLWWYLRMIALPHLGELGLFHDDFTVSTGILRPWTTLPAVAGIAAAIALASLIRKSVPVVSLGILWFLAGHLLESSVFSLELVHEHRNYLPSVGVLLGIVCGVYGSAGRIRLVRRSYLALPLAALFAVITFMRASDWSDPITLAAIEAERHPGSHRAVYELGRIKYNLFLLTGERRYLDESIAELERSAALDEHSKHPYFGLLRMGYVNAMPVDPTWTEILKFRLASTPVHPAEVLEFRNLSQCFASIDCRYPADLVYRLFDAVLSNPRLDDRRRAETLVNFAAFNVNAVGDVDTAITIIRDAIALRSDLLSYRRMLAQLLTMQNRNAEAIAVWADMRGRTLWRDGVLTNDEVARHIAELDKLSADRDETRDTPDTRELTGIE